MEELTFAQRPGSDQRPYDRLIGAALDGRALAVRPPGNRRGCLEDRGPGARRRGAGPPLRQGQLGARKRPIGCCPTATPGTTRPADQQRRTRCTEDRVCYGCHIRRAGGDHRRRLRGPVRGPGAAAGPAQVTLIDRAEHHLFQPLLYQCATDILGSPICRAAARPRRVRHRVRVLRPAGRRRRMLRLAGSGGRAAGRVRVYVTYNIKGGVGKTSTAVDLAAASGRRALLWDLDPQGAATYLVPGQAMGEGRPWSGLGHASGRRRGEGDRLRQPGPAGGAGGGGSGNAARPEPGRPPSSQRRWHLLGGDRVDLGADRQRPAGLHPPGPDRRRQHARQGIEPERSPAPP